MSVPYLVYLMISAKRQLVRFALAICATVAGLGVWFTGSRAAILAAGAALGFLALAHRHLIPRWTKVAAVSAATLGVLVAVAVLWHPWSTRPPAPLAELDVFRTSSFEARTYYWAAGWRMFRHRPLLGSGPDSYFANYTRFRLPADGAELGLHVTDRPHSIFLEYAVGGGIGALGSFLLLLVWPLWLGWQRLKALEGPERALVACLMAVLVAYIVQGAFSIDVPPLAVTAWMAIGALAAVADPKAISARTAIGQLRQGKRGPKRTRNQSPTDNLEVVAVTRRLTGAGKPVVQLAGLILAAAVLFSGLKPFVADVYARYGINSNSRLSPEAFNPGPFLKAIKLNPAEPTYHTLAGQSALAGAIST
ncbi:MAG: O-antigen ligase family protein, partial [Actinomycetota bacterium]